MNTQVDNTGTVEEQMDILSGSVNEEQLSTLISSPYSKVLESIALRSDLTYGIIEKILETWGQGDAAALGKLAANKTLTPDQLNLLIKSDSNFIIKSAITNPNISGSAWLYITGSRRIGTKSMAKAVDNVTIADVISYINNMNDNSPSLTVSNISNFIYSKKVQGNPVTGDDILELIKKDRAYYSPDSSKEALQSFKNLASLTSSEEILNFIAEKSSVTIMNEILEREFVPNKTIRILFDKLFNKYKINMKQSTYYVRLYNLVVSSHFDCNLIFNKRESSDALDVETINSFVQDFIKDSLRYKSNAIVSAISKLSNVIEDENSEPLPLEWQRSLLSSHFS